jgi:hypothetical protein
MCVPAPPVFRLIILPQSRGFVVILPGDYNLPVSIHGFVGTRRFRLLNRWCAIVSVVCFAVLTWQAPAERRGALGLLTALAVVGAAATWHQTRDTAARPPTRE